MNITEKVNNLLVTNKFNKTELAEKIVIQRKTLYTRLEKGNWKKGEIFIINSL